ncbi:hypothetical protein Stsp01_15380 [Streptomyces sp. NBRC 13847]|nr:hypothetical protein Stsp01_15380 [Streptomyces sp. NBRC 13847]
MMAGGTPWGSAGRHGPRPFDRQGRAVGRRKVFLVRHLVARVTLWLSSGTLRTHFLRKLTFW